LKKEKIFSLYKKKFFWEKKFYLRPLGAPNLARGAQRALKDMSMKYYH
jgi:hypothetical protein